MRFLEDFTICSLNGIDVILKNTFLGFNEVELQWKSKTREVIMEKNKKVVHLSFINCLMLHKSKIIIIAQYKLRG